MATKKTAAPRHRAAPKTTPKTTSRAKADPSLAARTARTIKQQPYTSAAIATGAVTAVAAAAAGLFFFSRRDKSLRETGDALASKVKDGLSEAKQSIKSLAARGSKLAGIGEDKPQSEIAEEALTLKQTGKNAPHPADPLVEEQTKAGAIAY